MAENLYLEEGERLKKVRKEIGVSAEEIAKKMGVVVQSYYQIEQGRSGFSMNLIKTMAREYNVNINYLLLGQGGMFLDEKNYGLTLIQESQNEEKPSVEDLHKMFLELKEKLEKLEKK